MRYVLLVSSCLLFSSCSLFQAAKENKVFNRISVRSRGNLPQTSPFSFTKGKVLIQASVTHEGKTHPGIFALDTGAPTVLSQSFANACGITTKRSHQLIETPTEGFVQDTSFRKMEDALLNIQDIQIHYNAIRVMPILKGNQVCDHIDGIIGSDAMSQFTLKVDFQDSSVTFYDKSKNAADIAGPQNLVAAIPFSTTNTNTPIVTLQIAGLEQRFIWDMGYNGSFIIQFDEKDDPGFLKLTGDTVGLKTSLMSGILSSGFGKDTQTTVYYNKVVQSAKAGTTDIPFDDKILNFKYNANLLKNTGNLGIGAMKDYINVLNWKDQEIRLFRKPGGTKKVPPVFYDLYATKGPDDKYYVSLLNIHSKWTRAGLTVKDRIIRINNTVLTEAISGLPICDRDSSVNALLKNATTLEIGRGGKLITYSIH